MGSFDKEREDTSSRRVRQTISVRQRIGSVGSLVCNLWDIYSHVIKYPTVAKLCGV